MCWEIFPMFGKPTIGNNQQRWDSVALGFEPAIANLFDASRNLQSRELPLVILPQAIESPLCAQQRSFESSYLRLIAINV